jgi:hypothetical protein
MFSLVTYSFNWFLANRLPNPPDPLFTSRPRRQSDIILQLQFRFRIIVSRLKSHAQLIFDGKHTIISQVFAVFVEDLRREVLVTFVADYKVDVCGAEGVAVHHLQEMTCGTVVGDLERRQMLLCGTGRLGILTG